jgi:small basic protein (TIGR04137 family)
VAFHDELPQVGFKVEKMTIDKSLRVARGSISNRNVLTRAERLTKLVEEDRWTEGDSPLGLPKVRVEKVSLKRKKKAKQDEGEDAADDE